MDMELRDTVNTDLIDWALETSTSWRMGKKNT